MKAEIVTLAQTQLVCNYSKVHIFKISNICLKIQKNTHLEKFPTATCRIGNFKFVSRSKLFAVLLASSLLGYKMTLYILKIPSSEAVRIRSDLNLHSTKFSEGYRAKLRLA